MITISVFKNIHYGQAIEAMLGERMSVVQKLKFVDQSGSRKRSPKNTRSEITPLEWELGKRPHNEEQRRPSRAFYRQHKEQEEHNNMRGIQSRVTGHESPHEQVTFSRLKGLNAKCLTFLTQETLGTSSFCSLEFPLSFH